MADYVIKVENLSKSYFIKHQQTERYTALRDVLANKAKHLGQCLLGRSTRGTGCSQEEFWALDDVSFEVKQGERVGIIGRNGAGKSTLLKVLSRITEPTKGRVRIKGRVASLLEVGTGFHPELTGRENIHLNGAILGMNRQEIKRRFDEIVTFAEVEKFLNTPVKRYSSGMYVRLAFAVAAYLEPEILVVDEVLAVGDVAFQKKCLEKMDEVASHGRTILFVSHNMNTISQLCDRAVMLARGKVIADSDTDSVVMYYLTAAAMKGGKVDWQDGWSNTGVNEFKFESIRIRNRLGQITDQLKSTESFWVEIDFVATDKLRNSRVGFLISTVEGIILFESYDTDCDLELGYRDIGSYTAICNIPAELLSEGQYLISVNAGIPNIRNLAFNENILSFHVTNTGSAGSEMISNRRGLIRPRLQWSVTLTSLPESQCNEYIPELQESGHPLKTDTL
jgi:lipopolysaccharide transport system ATP-binding protein